MARMFIIVVSLIVFTEVGCNASWLVFHKPAFKGKVVDIETNEPIEDAVVVAIYSKLQMAIGDSVVMSIHAKEALTNKKGEFVIPSYTTFINPLASSNPVEFIIFKPGYVCDGFYGLEEEFSGSGTRPDRDYFASWNTNLKYRILKSGILMLRKVSGLDRIESYNHVDSRISSFQKELPIANEMIRGEDATAPKSKRQLRKIK